MALTKYEKETVINFNEEESTASIYTHNERLRNRLAEFAAKSNDCCLVKKDDGCDEYKVPKSWIKVSCPRQYTDEQREKMAARARENLRRKYDE